MRIVDSILMELDQEARSTRRVLERVPTDRLGWKPHQKSMSLGQLALHIAQLPGTIAGFVAAPTLELPSEFKQAAATSTADVIAALDVGSGQGKRRAERA